MKDLDSKRVRTEIYQQDKSWVVEGYVDNREIMVVNNKVQGVWGVASSTCLPFDVELAKLYTVCEYKVFALVEGLQLLDGVLAGTRSFSGEVST